METHTCIDYHKNGKCKGQVTCEVYGMWQGKEKAEKPI